MDFLHILEVNNIMKILYLVTFIFLCGCEDKNCVDKMCPNEHNACVSCDKE